MHKRDSHSSHADRLRKQHDTTPRTSDFGVDLVHATPEQAHKVLQAFLKGYYGYKYGTYKESSAPYYDVNTGNIAEAGLKQALGSLSSMDEKSQALSKLFHAIAARADRFPQDPQDNAAMEQWVSTLLHASNEPPLDAPRNMTALFLYQGIIEGMKPERGKKKDQTVLTR